MLIAGLILIVAGIILFFVQKNQKHRAMSLKLAKPATTAELKQMASAIAQEIGGGDWREYVKVVGMIECDRPLVSQLKQEPCVYYKMDVRREYEETVTRENSDGKMERETQRGSESVSSNQQSIPFRVRDAAGEIEVNPEGGNIDTVKVLDEFRQEQARGGMISFGGFSLAVSGYGDGGRHTIGYRYSESVLPLQRRVVVVGTVSDSHNGLTLQKPMDGKPFIVSMKTDEALTKSADQGAQIAFYSMIACFVIGAILVVIGLVS